MDIPGLQFLLERYVRYAAARDPVLPLDREMVRSSRRVLVAVTTGMGDLILAAQKIAQDLMLTENGYRLVFNCGKNGGQEIFHIHLHLLGGRPMHWPPG